MEQDKKAYSPIRAFLNREDGAITVDWVVLTAALIFMAIAMSFVVTANIPGVADGVSTYMTSMEVGV